MGVNDKRVVATLKKAGLNEKEIRVYLSLFNLGRATPHMISQDTGVNRTTVYRQLENLEKLALVVRILDQHKTYFELADVSSLEQLVKQKVAEAQFLQTELEQIIGALQQNDRLVASSTTVKYFRGKEGLKQLLWDTLKAGAGNEVVGLGYRTWNEEVGKKFAEDLRKEYVARKIYSREILNSLPPIEEFTQHSIYGKKHYKAALIDEKILKIRYDTYIYRDVFAFYYVRDNEIFGVEMHNKEIADSQKQVFEILWGMARKL